LPRLAAAQGNPSAQVGLATLSFEGAGEPRDDAEAARPFGLAAAQGHVPQCLFELGSLFHQGNVVPLDSVEAARLWRLAVVQGHAEAQAFLGALHHEGTGVARDDTEAMRLFRLAISAGGRARQFERDDASRGAGGRPQLRRRMLHGLRRDAQAQDVRQVQGGALLRRGVRAARVGQAQAALQPLGGGGRGPR
jgi:TPR repeat protein